MTDLTLVELEQMMKEFIANQETIIAKHGYSVIMTCTEDSLPFCYTVGRAQLGLPELILFGMVEAGKSIINDISQLIHGDAIDKFYQHHDWSMPLYAGEASTIGEFARFAYSRQAQIDPAAPVKIMQVVIPDKNGRMPWEEGCDPLFVHLQPLHITRPAGRRMN